MDDNFIVSIEEFEDSKKYWMEKLSGDIGWVELPYDFKRTQGFKKGNYRIAFDKESSEKIVGICKGQDLLTYIMLVTVFKVLIYKYTNNNDIAIGSPVYSTTEEQYEYNKFIILRDFVDNGATFRELLANIKRTVVDGYKNQHYPMEKILEYLGIANTDLKTVIMSMEGLHKNKFSYEETGSLTADIIISILKADQGLEWIVEYNSSVFKNDTIVRLSNHYFYILGQVLSNINIRLSDIELIDNKEKDQILHVFNNTSVHYPEEMTVSEMFEKQVEKTPDSLAITSETGNHTYKELNEGSNKLAWTLREKGVKEDSIVGVMTDYTPEMVIGILGVLKAGSAYLPIDPSYPEDRINYMLEDSGVEILVTQKHLLNKIKVKKMQIICFGDDSINKQSCSNLNIQHRPEDLAYVIYTSGSTGKPKGTLIEHKALTNFVNWRIREYGFTADDRTLQLISISFDGFGANLYPAILSGGTLVLPGENHRGDFKYINNIIKEKKVTNMSVVPAMYRAILEIAQKDDLKTIRMVVLAGEKPDTGLIEMSIKQNPEIMLINEYGPTESCIAAASFLGMSPEYANVIGKPIANCRIYILDKNTKLVPVGIKGELCIAGVGLARGYLNRPELTAEKFVINPFSPGERLYKTGDMARWLSDGNIEFLGRADQQVKVRGYRVELEEIEEAIKKYEFIRDAVVVDKQDSSGNIYICAYFVSDTNMKVSVIREYLSGVLPEFMVPSRFVKLEKIPLTKNGKLDRKGLPEPGRDINTGEEYVEPQNSTEARLVEIWSKVLNTSRISIHDKFFDLGGNSILLMQVNSEIEKWIPGSVTITDLFTYPTVSKLAEFILRGQEGISKSMQLKCIDFPSDYFSGKSNVNAVSQFKYIISDSLLENIKKVSGEVGVEVQDILLSSFIYMLGKVSQNESIEVQVMAGRNDYILPVSIDLSNLESIPGLLRMVNKNKQSIGRDFYRINDLFGIKVDKTDNSIIPLYSIGSLPNDSTRLLDIYDIVFEATEEPGKVCLEFHFKGNRFNEDKAESLINVYLKIIGLLIDQCKPVEGEK